MSFCSQCGQNVLDGASFCTECGTPVPRADTPATGKPDTLEPDPPSEAPVATETAPSADPAPHSPAPPPVDPPAPVTLPQAAAPSGRSTRSLLFGGIAAVVVVVIAGAAFFATQQGDDDADGVVMPVAQNTVQESTSTTDGVASTASSTTATTVATTTTTLPPTTATTLPADLVAGVQGAGVFVAPGSTADQASLEASVANARNHEWALSVIAVPADPEGGSSAYAASIATAMNLGTVVVVSPDGLGWASQETQFYDSEFERAWDLIPPGSSEGTAVHSFVWSVLGGPDSVGLMVSSAAWLLLGADGMPSNFMYGDGGDTPLLGDWNCDGIETVGTWRPSDPTVFLRNSNSAGDAAVDYGYSYAGAVPIAGDFDGDGCGTVSFHIPGEARVFIFNTPEDLVESASDTIPADTKYAFGATEDIAFVGDFDGDGVDTIGLFRPSTGMFYLKNSHTEGPADIEFAFGAPGDIPVAGDWTDQDGVDSVAVYRPSTGAFYFRYTNTAGPADETLEFGVIDALPVAGAFGLDRSG